MELEVISAKFDDGSKSYYFDPKGEKYKIKDRVIVSTINGKEIATIVRPNFKINSEKFTEELQPVLRKANDKDLEIVQKHNEKAKRIFVEAEELINKMNLDMKLFQILLNYNYNIFLFRKDLNRQEVLLHHVFLFVLILFLL